MTAADESAAAAIEDAALRAARRGAQDAAVELFDASCRLTPPERLADLARRRLGEAAALLAVGELVQARSLAERAVVHARAEALVLLCDIAWAADDGRAASELLEEAATAAAAQPVLQARIFAKLVGYLLPVAPAKAVRYAGAATALLSAEREPGLLAYVLLNRFAAETMLGRGARRALFERGLELEARAGSARIPSAIPLIWFASTDDFDAARARQATVDAWYRELGQERRADALALLALTELQAGRWDLAEGYADASCAAVETLDSSAGMIPFRVRSLVDASRGRIERARATLLPLVAVTEKTEQWNALILSALGFVEFCDGDFAAADAAFVKMREQLDAVGIVESVGERSEPLHVESLLALGDLDGARETLLRLERRGRTIPRLWIDATLPRTRALVRAAEGNLAGALAELDVAPVQELPFELARTLLATGRLHRRARQKRAAADDLREALEIFERLGAPRWIEEARSELARVGLRHSSPHELTATELRVAELAAGGLTNREVAQAAFMSPKTVEANLARVYRKLGIRSRAELGARMVDLQT